MDFGIIKVLNSLICR